ncbi:MAG: helix-turn-helix domain-containing protein [Treponema sp.]|jgi:putative transposase|nr:helix-turn-helix domain-containing protein [Treponema sp.]
MAVKLADKTNLQNQALRLRIYPTKEQEILINKTFGCARKVYNNRIAEKQAFYEDVIKPEKDPQKRKELWETAHCLSEKKLKEQFSYLKEVSAQALCSATLNAETAYSNFLNSLMGRRKGKKQENLNSSRKNHIITPTETVNRVKPHGIEATKL